MMEVISIDNSTVFPGGNTTPIFQPEPSLADLQLVYTVLGWVSLSASVGGVTANVFTLIAANQMRLGTSGPTSGTMFIKCLACIDCGFVFSVGFMAAKISQTTSVELVTMHDLACKLGRLFQWVTSFWGKPKLAVKTTLAVGLIVTVLCAPTAVSVGIEGGLCFAGKHVDLLLPPLVLEWYIKGMALVDNMGIPFVTHVVLDSLILFKLKKPDSNISRKEKEITVSLLLVCFFYLATTAVIAMAMGTYAVMDVLTQRDRLLRKILVLVTELSAVLNHSVNFCFYMIGSQTFRHGFFSLFRSAEPGKAN